MIERNYWEWTPEQAIQQLHAAMRPCRHKFNPPAKDLFCGSGVSQTCKLCGYVGELPCTTPVPTSA